MTRTAPGHWTSPDGYRINRNTHDDGWVDWKVYRPGATKPCVVTAYLYEARDVVTNLRNAA